MCFTWNLIISRDIYFFENVNRQRQQTINVLIIIPHLSLWLVWVKTMWPKIRSYSRNTHLLPPKPKSSFRHLKRGIQDFHMNYVLVPADKAANNVVVVWRLYYINTLKRELVDTNAYKLQPSLSERVIVDGHGCHTALHFGVKAKENQDKVPTLYWLPKLHKKPYKARFIANSSSCTTTELSKLLTSCLTAVKNMLSNIVKKYMRDLVKTYFGRLKIQVKF